MQPLRNLTNIANGLGSKPVADAPNTGRNGAALPGSLSRDDPAFQAHVVALTERLIYVPEYSREIIDHFLQREQSLLRNAQYLSGHAEVTERMRCILIDWMVDVHIKFKLHPETFFLSVDIVDRYLMCAPATRATLQLVGVTATLLAAKLEEIWPPEIKDCIYISANTYTREEIIEKERDIVAVLSFKMSVPTSYPIATYLLDVVRADEPVRQLATMFLEYAALDYASLRVLPSQVACAAVSLALLTARINSYDATDCGTWADALPPAMAAEARTTPAAVAAPAAQLLAFATSQHHAGSKYQAIRRKYSSAKHCEVAQLTLPASMPSM